MGRRRLTVPAAAIAVLSIAVAFAGCGNPADLMDAAATEVRTAKDMYLVVKAISPSASAVNINPNSTLYIDFDRALDTSSVSAEAITIIPSAQASDPSAAEGWTWSYDAALKRLSLTPEKLDGGVLYLVNVGTGLKSAAGEPLVGAYSWSFTTANVPSGSVLINGGAAYANTSTSSIVLTLSPNNLAKNVRYSLGAAPGGAYLSIPLNMSVTYNPVSSFLSGGDATYTLYYQFQSDASNGFAESEVKTTTIILDTTAPSVPTVSASSLSTHYPTFSWSSGGGGSGTYKYYLAALGGWSAETSSTSRYLSEGLADGTYNFYVVERDVAGNWSSNGLASATLNAPPNAPSVSGSTGTINTYASWSWSSGGFGSGTYQYWLVPLDSAWTTTTATSHTRYSLGDGEYTLYVRELDAGSEASAYTTKTTTISPYLPFSGQTGISTTPTFSWREPGAATYYVQLKNGKFWTTIGTVTESDRFTYSTPLSTGTTYTWRVYYTVAGTNYYITPSTGSSFTTTTRFIKGF